MRTFKEWNESKVSFEKFISDREEIDDKIYYYFLEILPPRIMKGYGFLLGEPCTHNKKGYALYESFYESPSGKFFYGGLKTLKEFTDSRERNWIL